MKYLISILLALVIFSCKTSSYASFKAKSLKHKGGKIDEVYIHKYSLSSLVQTNTVSTTPLLEDSTGKSIEPEVYFLENNYFESLITEKYYNEKQDVKDAPKDVFKAFKDSVEKIHPRKNTLKEISLLSDSIIKFRKKIIDNEDNASSSYEYYTLVNIIQPNYFYVISWYNEKHIEKQPISIGPHADTYYLDHWLEIQINEKREIIYWKEIDMKLFIKNERPPLFGL